jgi:hypothetical protein
MSDTKDGPLTAELIANCMNELARELGTMDPDDPRGAEVAAELSLLLQLKRSVRLAGDSVIGQCLDELAREIVTLKPSDSRRKEIIEEIIRLRDLSSGR